MNFRSCMWQVARLSDWKTEILYSTILSEPLSEKQTWPPWSLVDQYDSGSAQWCLQAAFLRVKKNLFHFIAWILNRSLFKNGGIGHIQDKLCVHCWTRDVIIKNAWISIPLISIVSNYLCILLFFIEAKDINMWKVSTDKKHYNQMEISNKSFCSLGSYCY